MFASNISATILPLYLVEQKVAFIYDGMVVFLDGIAGHQPQEYQAQSLLQHFYNRLKRKKVPMTTKLEGGGVKALVDH